MRTSNPMFNEDRFAGAARVGAMGVDGAASGYGAPSTTGWDTTTGPPSSDRMTLNGTLGAASLLLALVVAAGFWSWQLVDVRSNVDITGAVVTSVDMPTWVGGLMIGSIIVALVASLAGTLRPRWARIAGPIYAVAEGVVLGIISHLFEASYPGIAVQAVLGTIAATGAVLLLYRLRVLRATPRFRRIVLIATMGALFTYLGGFVISLVTGEPSFVSSGGILGIGLSVVLIVIASMNLVLDFDLIETGVERGYPSEMEWYAALGLMVTLVWLYLEMLRLLSKLRD